MDEERDLLLSPHTAPQQRKPELEKDSACTEAGSETDVFYPVSIQPGTNISRNFGKREESHVSMEDKSSQVRPTESKLYITRSRSFGSGSSHFRPGTSEGFAGQVLMDSRESIRETHTSSKNGVRKRVRYATVSYSPRRSICGSILGPRDSRVFWECKTPFVFTGASSGRIDKESEGDVTAEKYVTEGESFL
ncbi:hypothetical protein ACOMHN_052085 [Nucella lapillus]